MNQDTRRNHPGMRYHAHPLTDQSFYNYSPESHPNTRPINLTPLNSAQIASPVRNVSSFEVSTQKPIIYNPVKEESEEAISKKRQKQNEAAQRCRQRKAEHLKQFDSTIKTLETEKYDLMVKAAILAQEKQAWISREEELKSSIRMYKKQLDAAHSVLFKNDH
jgi:hypothetical protein